MQTLQFNTPSRKSLIIALAIMAIEGLRDERILEVRHHAGNDVEKADWTKDKLFMAYGEMQQTLRTKQYINLNELYFLDGRVNDKLAWAQQMARISYEEWEEVIIPVY